MAALSAVFALGLMAYVPGRLLLRLFLPAGAAMPRGRLLLELLLGNATLSLLGFALAETGFFSLTAVLAGLTLVSLAAFAVGRGRASGAFSTPDAAGLLVALIALLWVMPPFDTALWGNDSSVYVGGGLSLARHGALPYPDPSSAELSREERASLFPTYGRLPPGEPPFVRLSGGLLLHDLDDPIVLPAFHHLLSVWAALSWSIGGDAAATAPAAYFAALSVWAIAAFAARLGGVLSAALAALFLVSSAPQYWYSRFLMPEVPSQYFLWAGMVAAAVSLDAGRGRLGAVAGIGLGVAGLMRLDGLAHTIAALALWKAISPGGGAWPGGAGFVPAFGVLTLWAVAHQIAFPTHYYPEMVHSLRRGWAQLRLALGGMAGFAGAIQPLQPALRISALALFAVYLVGTFGSSQPDFATSLGWMRSYVGWPALIAGGAGVVLWWRLGRNPAERFALVLGLLVTAQLFYDPRVTPAPLWAVRRFVPVAIPLLLIGAALTASALYRRHWLAGAVAVVVILAGTGTRNVFEYRGGAFQESLEHVRSIGASLPPNAVLVVEPILGAQTQIHIAVWSALGIPTYLLRPEMRQLADLRDTIGARPLYWLGGDEEAGRAKIAAIADPVATYRFGVGLRRLDWYDARDDFALREQTLWLYRLRPGDSNDGGRGALH